MNKHANLRKEREKQMLEHSTKAMKNFIATLEEQEKECQQLIQKREPIAIEAIARNQKLIDGSKTPPIEQLRALIVNVVESENMSLLHRQHASLLQTMLFANCIRIFQEETAYELNMLNAKTAFRHARKTPKGEEPEEIIRIKKEQQRIKHIIDEEWKPMMDGLKEEIDKRNKYLKEHK